MMILFIEKRRRVMIGMNTIHSRECFYDVTHSFHRRCCSHSRGACERGGSHFIMKKKEAFAAFA